MGDIFDRIQENAKAEFTFARAQIIMEFEATLSAKQKENKEWFPTWLQVLVPTLQSVDVDEGDWVGRVRALKNSIRGVNEKLGESEKARKESEKKREKDVEERKKDVEELKKKLEESEKERKEEVKELKKQMEESKKERKAEADELKGLLQMLCATMTPEEQEERKLNFESNHILKELGATEEDLDLKTTDAESKNKALEDMKKKREEESSRLEKEVEGMWKTLESSKEDQKAFKEKVETTGKLKQAGLTLLKEEADRLWEMESDKLMEELGIMVEDLDQKPTDAESKNRMLWELKG